MPDPIVLLGSWLFLISIVAVWLTVKDKRAARRGKRRVAERTLLLVALLGGSAAMFVTMQLIRHKTQKPQFTLGVPFVLIIQIAAVLFWYCR